MELFRSKVRLGVINNNLTNEATRQEYKITKVLTHRNYTPYNGYSNIAIVHLDRDVTINGI